MSDDHAQESDPNSPIQKLSRRSRMVGCASSGSNRDHERAIRSGKTRRVPLRSVTMRLPVPDLKAAQELAARKSLPYQTYIKMLLHEALEKERRSA